MRATRSEWSGRVRRWRASGLTAGRFAAREGFDAKTLRWWAWRLGSEQRHAKPRATFVEVSVAPPSPVSAPAPAPSPIEVIVGDSLRVLVRPGFDRESLRQVLGLLGDR